MNKWEFRVETLIGEVIRVGERGEEKNSIIDVGFGTVEVDIKERIRNWCVGIDHKGLEMEVGVRG